MSRRTSIVKAFAEEFKKIDGTGSFGTNIFNNSYPYLKFWDEVNDFPCIYISAGSEYREYHPSGFAWGFLNISVKLYIRDEDSLQKVEDLLEDVEKVITNSLGVIIYDSDNNLGTSEISITSITTDEGLFSPIGVGEVNLLVRYQVV